MGETRHGHDKIRCRCSRSPQNTAQINYLSEIQFALIQPKFFTLKMDNWCRFKEEKNLFAEINPASSQKINDKYLMNSCIDLSFPWLPAFFLLLRWLVGTRAGFSGRHKLQRPLNVFLIENLFALCNQGHN